MDAVTIKRSELYDLIWSTPMTTLAKKYLISDSGLRKICVKMDIPMPKSGHWEKLRAKKKVDIKKLPANYSGNDEVHLSLRKEGEENFKGALSPETILINEIENDSSLNLVVPEKLTNPHKLIIEAKQLLTDRQGHHRGSLVGSWESKIRITVSKENIPRALRIMDTFIKAIEKRGHTFLYKNNLTYVVVQGEEFAINLREKNKRVPNTTNNYSWQTYDFVATGILAFVVRINWNDTEWKDGKLPLEQQLSKIIARLEIKGAFEKEERIKRKKQREIQEELDRIKKEQQELKEQELLKFKELKKNSEYWQEASQIRTYLFEMEQKANAQQTMNDELKEWLKWAHKKADWYDPITATKDELLEGVDKASLTFKKSGYY